MQVAFSVDYGRDNHFRTLYVVDNPIAVSDHFAQVFILELRHLAAGKWKFLKCPRERDDASNYRPSVKRGIRGIYDAIASTSASARGDQTTR